MSFDPPPKNLLTFVSASVLRVAVALWCLATPTEYRTLVHLFGIHVARSTVCMRVHNTCKATVDVLTKEYIRFPAGQD